MHFEKRSMKRWATLLLIAALTLACAILLSSCGACEHQWNEGIVTKFATEQEEGEKTFQCSLCGTTKTEAIEKLSHTHVFSGEYTKTETEHTQACACGVTMPGAHDYFAPETRKAASCTEKGLMVEVCKICAYEKETELDILEHDYTNWAVTTNATCMAEGEKTRECRTCDLKETNVVPQLKIHSLTSNADKTYYHEAKKATCTEDGSPEYWTCTVCAKHFADNMGKTELAADELVIPASGHMMTHVAAVQATCDQPGVKEHYSCSLCKLNFADEEGKTVIEGEVAIAQLKHNMTKTEKKDPTCTEAGNVEYYTCSICTKKYSTEEGKAENLLTDVTLPAAHKYAWTTSTEDATKCTSTCTVCSTVGETREHVYDQVNVQPATCDELETTTYTCACGATKTSKTPAIGHVFGTGVAAEDGSTVYTCYACYLIYTAPKSAYAPTVNVTEYSRNNNRPDDPNLTFGLGGNANAVIGSNQWAEKDYILEFSLRYDEFMSSFEVRLRSNEENIGTAGRGPVFDIKSDGTIQPSYIGTTTLVPIVVPVDDAPASYKLSGYGWHRLAFQFHEDAAIVGDAVDYTTTVTLYVDGVKIGDYVENPANKVFAKRQWLTYTAEIVDGALVKKNSTFNPFFQGFKGGFYNNKNSAHILQIADVNVMAANAPTAVQPIEYVNATFPKTGKINGAYVTPSYAVSDIPYFYVVGKDLGLPTPMQNGKVAALYADEACTTPLAITAATTGKVTAYAGEYKFIAVPDVAIDYVAGGGVTLDMTGATTTFTTQGTDLTITLPKAGATPNGFTAGGWYLDGKKIAEVGATTATVPASRAAIAAPLRVMLSVYKVGSQVEYSKWNVDYKENNGVSTVGEGYMHVNKNVAAKDLGIYLNSALPGLVGGSLTHKISLAATAEDLAASTVLPIALRSRSGTDRPNIFMTDGAGNVKVGNVPVARLTTELQEFTFVLTPKTVGEDKYFIIDVYVDGVLVAANFSIKMANSFDSYTVVNYYVNAGATGAILLGDYTAYIGNYIP